MTTCDDAAQSWRGCGWASRCRRGKTSRLRQGGRGTHGVLTGTHGVLTRIVRWRPSRECWTVTKRRMFWRFLSKSVSPYTVRILICAQGTHGVLTGTQGVLTGNSCRTQGVRMGVLMGYARPGYLRSPCTVQNLTRRLCHDVTWCNTLLQHAVLQHAVLQHAVATLCCRIAARHDLRRRREDLRQPLCDGRLVVDAAARLDRGGQQQPACPPAVRARGRGRAKSGA